MEPLTLSLIIGAGTFLTSALGYAIGRRKGNQESGLAEAQQKARREARDHKNTKTRLDWAEEAMGRQSKTIARLTAERDQATAIAATRDVALPDPAKLPEIVEVQVWEDRWYSGHPEQNLVHLAEDLQQHAGKEVLLDVVMVPHGGWPVALQDAWGAEKHLHGAVRKAPAERLPAGKGWFHFEGPTKRVLQSLHTLLWDDDSGFVRVARPRGKKPVKIWKDADSPMVFKVNMKVREIPKGIPAPAVHYRDVAVVQVNEVERVVEKPVFVSIPEGREAELCGHTKEEIRGMVEDVLAREKAAEEVEALGQLVDVDATDSTQARSAQARAAQAARAVHPVKT